MFDSSRDNENEYCKPETRIMSNRQKIASFSVSCEVLADSWTRYWYLRFLVGSFRIIWKGLKLLYSAFLMDLSVNEIYKYLNACQLSHKIYILQ